MVKPSFGSDLSTVLFTKGQMYYSLGRYGSACENFREAAREDPANLEIRKFLYLAEAKAAHKPSAIAVYEEAIKKEPRSYEPYLNLAIVLYLEGEMVRAQASIENANRLSPHRGETLFFRGIISLKRGAIREAIEDLQQARRLEPRLEQGAMLYEALGLYELGDRNAAAKLFRKVVAANPLNAHANYASNYLQRTDIKRFSAKLATGVEYDTNVIIIGDENTLGVPLDVPDKEQFRIPFSVLLNYRFLDVGRWYFGARYDLFASIHEKSNDMNVISNLGEIYGVWRAPKYYIRPFYHYRNITLDSERYSDNHTLGGSFRYFARHNLAPGLYFRWQHRNYHNPTTDASDPDGQYFRGYFNQYLFLQRGRGYIRAGLGGDGSLTDGDNMDYTSFLVLAGFQYQLPWQIRFQFDFEYQDRPYSNVHTTFGKKRHDLRYFFAWELSRPIARGFELSGRITQLRNDSNIGDYDYDRQIFSLLLSWRY